MTIRVLFLALAAYAAGRVVDAFNYYPPAMNV